MRQSNLPGLDAVVPSPTHSAIHSIVVDLRVLRKDLRDVHWSIALLAFELVPDQLCIRVMGKCGLPLETIVLSGV